MASATKANLEVVQRAFAALNDRDIEGLMSCYTDDFVFDGSRLMEGVYEGKDAWRSFNEELIEMTDMRHENLSLLTEGDRVIVLADIIGEGSTSGVSLQGRMAYVYEFRGGLISRMEAHPDAESLLRSLGIEE